MTHDKTTTTSSTRTTTTTPDPAHMPPSYERPMLKLKRSSPAKRAGVTNHTFTFGGMTLLIQTRGGAGPKKMCSPGIIFVPGAAADGGDLAVCKNSYGNVDAPPDVEKKILDAALPLFDDDERAIIMEPGWEGLRLNRTMNKLTCRAEGILREGDRPDAHARTKNTLTILLRWGDSWPGGTFPVRHYKASFGIDYGLSLTWEEALEQTRQWAASLSPEDAARLEKATDGAGVNMPPEELRTADSLRRDFNSAASPGPLR